MSHVGADLQLVNAAFANAPGVEEPETDTPPNNLAEMFNMFVQMKSQFTKAVMERDVKIEALSKKIIALEEAAKKPAKPANQKTPDNIITEMKKEYSENMKTMKATVAAQQKTLEDLQNDKRAKNLVITGVPEPTGSPPDVRKEDQATTERIFTTAGCPGVAPCRVIRLGKKREVQPQAAEDGQVEEEGRPPPPRPLLVTLNSVNEVRAVMKERHKLKDNHEYNRVFIKRDQHPLIRKEW